LPSTGDADPAQVLRHRLREPVRKYLEPAKLVLYSPDGALGRLPFAALPSLDGKRYLIEDCLVVAVTAPQLLTEYAAPPAAPAPDAAGLLLVGGLDFDAPASTTVGTARSVAATGKTRPTWAALPGTAAEAKEIGAAFRGTRSREARTLDAGTATEEAVRAAVPNYRYLHIATHGFFAPPTVRRARLPGSYTSMSLTPPNLGERLRGSHPGLERTSL